MSYHPLLERQLKKVGISNANQQPSVHDWTAALDRVSAYYTQADHDRYRLERSLVLVTDEMQDEIEARKTYEWQLQQVNQELARTLNWIDDSLIYLNEQIKRGVNQPELLNYISFLLKTLEGQRAALNIQKTPEAP